MDREEKKLMDEIRNGLHHFELPYEEGNWEKFQQMYREEVGDKQRRLRKKPVALWKYISAAAVLIGALIFMPWDRPEIRNKKADPIARHEQGPVVNERPAPRRPTVRQTTAPAYLVEERNPDIQTPGTDRAEAPSIVSLHKDPGTTDPIVPPSASDHESPSTRWKDISIAANERQNEPEPVSGRWKFGVEINSSFTSDKPNVAAGVLAQYQVSDKIRLSTGVTYSSMAAEHASGPVQLSYNTKIVGGETMIKAIDIPLTVVYEPSDGWFASVGVSALAVLSEDKIRRMESEALQETVMLDPESGAAVSVFEVVKKEYTERSQDTDFEGRSNLRYLNLSLGKKQRLNKRTEILFEPFVKIPMGGLQRKDINLLNSGIKLKLLF